MKNLCTIKFTTLTAASLTSAAMAYIMLLCDNIILGYFIGETAIGGIGLVSPIYTFTVYASSLITIGSNFCTLNEASLFHEHRMKSYFTAGIALSIGLGVILFIIAVVSKDAYFYLIDDTAMSYIYASSYYNLFVLVLLVYPINAFLQQMIFSEGDEGLFIISSICQVVGDIVLSIVLCQHLGVKGVAIGSFLGIVISIGVLCIRFAKKSSLGFNGRLTINKARSMWEISKYPAVSLILKSLLLYLINNAILYTYGEQSLPAVTALNLVIGAVSIFIVTGTSSYPLLVLYKGEGNVAKLRETMKLAFRFTVISALAGTVLMLLFADNFIHVIGIRSATLAPICITGARILALSYLFSSVLELLVSYHVAVGNIKYSYGATIADLLVIKILIVVPLVIFKGVIYLFVGYSLSPLIVLILSATVFHSKCDIRLWPSFMDSRLEKETYSFDILLSPEAIRDLQLKFELLMDTYEIDPKTKLQTSIITEELLNLVIEKNPGKIIYAECTLQFRNDNFYIIFKDNGILFNLTDSDSAVENFREFFISSVIEQTSETRNLITLCYNRSAFRFRY